jgi:CBS domain-containing protein
MDMVVIPKYKKLYSSNRFFKELVEATYHKTDNHNTNVNYTTGIDVMSSNPTDRTKVAEVIEAFNRLTTKDINGLPMVDAFFYYDLIAYDRQPGQ